jgi:hypothetical protein
VLLTAPLKLTAAVEKPLHTDWLDTVATVGVGLTAIEKDVGAPEQPVADGVTVIFAVAIDAPELPAVNDAILPIPLDARPIDVLSFVQLYVAPLIAPLKLIAAVDAPLHNTCPETSSTVGVGLTLIVNEVAEPTQPVADGVAVIFAVAIDVPAFVAVNDAMLPTPLPVSPIEVLSLVQL